MKTFAFILMVWHGSNADAQPVKHHLTAEQCTAAVITYNKAYGAEHSAIVPMCGLDDVDY